MIDENGSHESQNAGKKHQQKANNTNRIEFRLDNKERPLYESMTKDFYRRGHILKPTFNALAKVCVELVATNYTALGEGIEHLECSRQLDMASSQNASLKEQRDALLKFHYLACSELDFLHELLTEKAGPFHSLNITSDNHNTRTNDQNSTGLKT